jgi:uncharacterized membrane protein SirB2
MIEFYTQIKQFHIFVALLSGSLFALRGAFVIAARAGPCAAGEVADAIRWTRSADGSHDAADDPPRRDVRQRLAHAEVALVVVYIVLGVFALKRARTPRSRLGFYLAALLVYFAIYSIARAHHPLGCLLTGSADGPEPFRCASGG